ncbi:MAG: LON peptidase substrate-binding domain-containing protein, partial [Armatimonadota bacterium]
MQHDTLPGLILPVVAVRDAVYFPGAHFPLLASRERSVRAIEQSQQYHDGQILLVTQRDISDEASPENLVNVGVLATIENVAWLQDGIARVTLSAGSRVAVRGYVATTPTMVAAFDCIADVESEVDTVERQALARLVVEAFELLVEEGVISHPDALAAVSGPLDSSCITDHIGPYLPTSVDEKVALLTEVDPGKRLNMVHALLMREKHVSAVRQQIRERLDHDFERVHRADILREQLKAIQAELDVVDPREDGNLHTAKLAADSDIPESVRKVILEEISRYERLPSNST